METAVHFDTTDKRVLRYLERKCIEGGGDDWVDIMPDDIMRDNGLNPEKCKRLIARFKQIGIIETLAADGTLAIMNLVCHYVAELDRQPPPDYLQIAKTWAFSKPWLVYPGILLLIILPWCVGLVKVAEFIIEWYGVK
jgi:hypothetical protein